MDALKIKRTPLRSTFTTKTFNALNEILSAWSPDVNVTGQLLNQLVDKSTRLLTVAHEILNCMLVNSFFRKGLY